MSDARVEMSAKTIFTLGILVVVLAGAAWGTWYISQEPVHSEADTAAAVTLVDSEDTPYTTLDGTPFRFNDIRGQVRVITTWASWVPASATELPLLDTLAAQYSDSKVVVVAINRKEPRQRIEAFLQKLPSLSDIQIVIDETDAYYAAVAGYAMPETRIYDTTGEIIFEKRGPVTADELTETLDAVLLE